MVALKMLRRQQEHAEIVSRREWTRNLAVCSAKNSCVAMLGTGDADLLIAFLPGTAATRHMLNEKRLAAAGGASIVNVDRGIILDQKALEKEPHAFSHVHVIS